LEFVAHCNRFTFLSPAEDNDTVKTIKICRHVNASGVIIKESMKLVLRHTNKRSLKIKGKKNTFKPNTSRCGASATLIVLLANSKGG
jgi:hypothetical protein